MFEIMIVFWGETQSLRARYSILLKEARTPALNYAKETTSARANSVVQVVCLLHLWGDETIFEDPQYYKPIQKLA